MNRFIKDRHEAFADVLYNDSTKELKKYCHKYGVPYPSKDKVAIAGALKAIRGCTDFTDADKAMADKKCIELGFSPFGGILMSRPINAEPTAPQFDEWINVEDRLPERNKTVLVYVIGSAWDEPDAYVSTDRLLSNGLWETYHLSVSHWMPLPEPPEEEEDK